MTLEELKKARAETEETPKCFVKCERHGCDMEYKHCGNNEWPALVRCINCQFWFTNLEKLEKEQKHADDL